ncbi:hypothetical protein V9T40_003896 [Parthenolecanium corni]|uniref:SDR family NAD(P)-dependent oxidoreductase n=1 Tax=Parthenolecanium corni TaxID=536013 RepID=A0AAN9TDX6_9HEMI
MERFVGKVAVVTGSSSGIGKQTAKELLKRQVNVVGLARNLSKLQAISEEIKSQPEIYTGSFQGIKCDVTREEEVIEVFSQIKSKYGSISILINNAANMDTVTEEISTTTIEKYDQVFNTNLKGYVHCAREAIKLMTDDTSGGHIVYISSLLGLLDYQGSPLYSASKKAARVFSGALRYEMIKHKRNIKISTIYPGLVDTDLAASWGGPMPENKNEILDTETAAKSIVAVIDTPPSLLFPSNVSLMSCREKAQTAEPVMLFMGVVKTAYMSCDLPLP